MLQNCRMTHLPQIMRLVGQVKRETSEVSYAIECNFTFSGVGILVSLMSTAEHMFHVVRGRTFAALILRGSSFLLVIVLSGCGAFIAHAPSRAVSHHASATPAPKPTVVPVAVPTACAASMPKSYSDVFVEPTHSPSLQRTE